MLQAIDNAESCIALSTYIFDDDAVGREFADALARAVDRKVEVRVLIDDMGARYSWPTMVSTLHRAGVNCTTFLPPFIPGSSNTPTSATIAKSWLSTARPALWAV